MAVEYAATLFSIILMAPAQSSHFCRTELARALREQAYAIKEFALTASDVHQASADVVILEGIKVVVTLTIHGSAVRFPTPIHEG